MTAALKAPFPYFGGKSKIAPLVWQRFGRVANYVEPFFGSGAVLLGCPWPGHTETVNDADGLLCNFWRALQADPEAVARYADWPVNELDLHARHRWLVAQRADVERLLADPLYYDAQIAGWWVWGISQWIGGGWCSRTTRMSVPHFGDAGKGPHRKSLGQLPYLNERGGGNTPASRTGDLLLEYFTDLAARLRRVRVTCGDWSRICGPSVTWRHGVTAVFLDPPYVQTERADVYAVEDAVFEAVRAWAIAEGTNPLMRIALCGYDFEMPAGWIRVDWKAAGGYGSQGNGRGRENAARECIWFSPHCLHPSRTLLDLMAEVPA